MPKSKKMSLIFTEIYVGETFSDLKATAVAPSSPLLIETWLCFVVITPYFLFHGSVWSGDRCWTDRQSTGPTDQRERAEEEGGRAAWPAWRRSNNNNNNTNGPADRRNNNQANNNNQ